MNESGLLCVCCAVDIFYFVLIFVKLNLVILSLFDFYMTFQEVITWILNESREYPILYSRKSTAFHTSLIRASLTLLTVYRNHNL